MTTLTTIDTHFGLELLACAYLRVHGDEAIFIETNTVHARPRLLEALAAAGRRPEDVRYVIVTHAHLDHASGAWAVLESCPGATLLAHPRAARHLVDPSRLLASARQVYGDSFDAQYGRIEPIPQARVQTLEDGATVEVGGGALRFWHTEGHARHHFVVHDEALNTVFTGDAFGLVYPSLQRGGRLAFPSTSPIDYDGPAALAAVDHIEGLGAARVGLTHFGTFSDVGEIAAQLRWWLSRTEALVEDFVSRGVQDARAALKERLRAHLLEAAGLGGVTLAPADEPLLEVDLELNAQGLAFSVARRLAAGR